MKKTTIICTGGVDCYWALVAACQKAGINYKIDTYSSAGLYPGVEHRCSILEEDFEAFEEHYEFEVETLSN